MDEEHLVLAQKLLNNGDYATARVMFDEILAENPQDINALSGLSYALEHLGLVDEALEVVQSALDIAPDNPELHFRLSGVYYKMKELQKARFHVRSAIVYAPEVAKYHWEMARLSNALKDTVTAVEHLEIARRLDPAMFNKRAHIGLWGLILFVELIKLRGLIAWGILATYILLAQIEFSSSLLQWLFDLLPFEIEPESCFLLKLLLAEVPFIGVAVYYGSKHHYRRAAMAFFLGLMWGGGIYAIAQRFFLS